VHVPSARNKNAIAWNKIMFLDFLDYFLNDNAVMQETQKTKNKYDLSDYFSKCREVFPFLSVYVMGKKITSFRKGKENAQNRRCVR
jgi:hypothetical protein